MRLTKLINTVAVYKNAITPIPIKPDVIMTYNEEKSLGIFNVPNLGTIENPIVTIKQSTYFNDNSLLYVGEKIIPASTMMYNEEKSLGIFNVYNVGDINNPIPDITSSYYNLTTQTILIK